MFVCLCVTITIAVTIIINILTKVWRDWKLSSLTPSDRRLSPTPSISFFITNIINIIIIVVITKGRHKKLLFLLLVKRWGRGLGQSKNSLSENTQIFDHFLTILFIKGGLGQSKKSLSENTQIFDHFWPFFLPFYSLRGVLPNPKNPYQKKLRRSKKRGGVSAFY